MSKIPESGVLTLRRKFSSQPGEALDRSHTPVQHRVCLASCMYTQHQLLTVYKRWMQSPSSINKPMPMHYWRRVKQYKHKHGASTHITIDVYSQLSMHHTDSKSPANDVKFYTLNRRAQEEHGSLRPSQHRGGQSTETTIRDWDRKQSIQGFLISATKTTSQKLRFDVRNLWKALLDHPPVNGVKEEDKKFAREILSSKIERAAHNEQRHSNGILMGPVSTKGEVTMTQSTKSSPHTKSPLTTRKKAVQKSPSPPPEVEPPKILKDESPEPSTKLSLKEKSPEPSNEKRFDSGGW